MSEGVESLLNKDSISPRQQYQDGHCSPPHHSQTEGSKAERRIPSSRRRNVEQHPFVLEQDPQAWHIIRETLGTEEALRLAQLRRNDAMTTLRVEHRWSLQAIGDLFDLSRERVRQLTPCIEGNGTTPGPDNQVSDPTIVKLDLAAAFRRAVRNPKAWNGRGQVCKSWVIRQLGYEPDLPDLDFRRLSESKVEFILRYGVGLSTRRQMQTWLREMYFGRHKTYAEIAYWLSERFVSVAPMTVHRFATRVMNVEAYGRGKRVDR